MITKDILPDIKYKVYFLYGKISYVYNVPNKNSSLTREVLFLARVFK